MHPLFPMAVKNMCGEGFDWAGVMIMSCFFSTLTVDSWDNKAFAQQISSRLKDGHLVMEGQS